ncbi:MAG: hypothetical protein V8T87_04035 [Victivallales bacterium]
MNNGEIELTRKVLDLYALYIREYQDALELSQILDLYKMLNRYQAVIEQWKSSSFPFRRKLLIFPRHISIWKRKIIFDLTVRHISVRFNFNSKYDESIPFDDDNFGE